MQYTTIAYHQSTRRLFLLDYDGTLVNFTARPEQSKPSGTVLKILQILAEDPRNTVVIVSGRDRDTLQAWLGHLPVDLSAEYGFQMRQDGEEWKQLSHSPDPWRKLASELMLAACAQTPGSFIEEKTAALVWHYRQSKDNETTRKVKVALLQKLRVLCRTQACVVLDGNKVIEIKKTGFDKGTAAQHWLASQNFDFIFAAGDDTTDEDLFAALPESSCSVKVGAGPTIAQHRLANPQELLAYLKQLTRPAP